MKLYSGHGEDQKISFHFAKTQTVFVFMMLLCVDVQREGEKPRKMISTRVSELHASARAAEQPSAAISVHHVNIDEAMLCPSTRSTTVTLATAAVIRSSPTSRELYSPVKYAHELHGQCVITSQQ